MRIFTFWEPRTNMPEYLKLCMRTWTKFIPDAEIVLLDYSNLSEWIDIREFGDNLLDGRFTLPQIADAIRVMLLEKYGGLWMDVDTIILNEQFLEYLTHKKETAFFGYHSSRSVHIAWISSCKDSKMMKEWLDYQKNAIKNFKKDEEFWAYLGNRFVTPYCETHTDDIEIFDVHIEGCMPELKEEGANAIEKYRKFYFESKQNFRDIDTRNLLMLHNSWTPVEYKNMSEKVFLESGCTMANILSEILQI